MLVNDSSIIECVGKGKEAGLTQDEFDPIDYIEKAFVDTGHKVPTAQPENLEMELPSIQEFLQGAGGEEEEPAPKVAKEKKAPRAPKKPRTGTTDNPKLSAPRPRRKAKDQQEVAVDPSLSATWELLPRNIQFLSSFFDDAVTANYYRGDFRESREELIRRILDPELTLEEVSRLLGVCPATVRRYTNRGWLEHHRTQGGQRRFRLSGMVKFVEEHGRKA